MVVEYGIITDEYHDSVELMRTADEVARSYDLSEAFALMATDANKTQLTELVGLESESLSAVDPDDILLVAVVSEQRRAEQAVSEMRERLSGASSESTVEELTQTPKSLPAAVEQSPEASIALISVPGEYAVREAWLALHAGLHVHLFSDNVPIEDERALKEFGRANDQLVMGPDCGTALIDGVPLGFANVVSQGSVGIVSASGTGLQEVATLLDRAGAGVSHAIGTGGRDLQDAVGGLTTCQGIEWLDADDGTESIVVISKPPQPEARDAVLQTVAAADTPIIVQFLGTEPDEIESAGATPAENLTEAARLAVDTTGDNDYSIATESVDDLVEVINEKRQPGGGTDVRGLFSGGTLCTEAALVLADRIDGVRTNVGVGDTVENPLDTDGHVLVDLGAEEFTRGRPHPMIEPGVRDRQLDAVLTDEEVGLVLLDVVLGRGVHDDPAAGIVAAIEAASSPPPVVVSVCGTDADPQSRTRQIERLREAGVIVAPSNATAAAAVGAATSSGGGQQ